MTEDSPTLRWMIHVTCPKVSHLVAKYETECGTNAASEQIRTERAQKSFLVTVEKATKTMTDKGKLFSKKE